MGLNIINYKDNSILTSKSSGLRQSKLLEVTVGVTHNVPLSFLLLNLWWIDCRMTKNKQLCRLWYLANKFKLWVKLWWYILSIWFMLGTKYITKDIWLMKYRAFIQDLPLITFIYIINVLYISVFLFWLYFIWSHM